MDTLQAELAEYNGTPRVDWPRMAFDLNNHPYQWIRVRLSSITGSSKEDKRSNLRGSLTRRMEGTIATKFDGESLLVQWSPSAIAMAPLPGPGSAPLTKRDLENRTYKLHDMGGLRTRLLNLRMMDSLLDLQAIQPELPKSTLIAMAIDAEYDRRLLAAAQIDTYSLAHRASTMRARGVVTDENFTRSMREEPLEYDYEVGGGREELSL